MNARSPIIVLFVVSLLFSCLPKKTDFPGTEVPSGPLVQALDERRLSISGLRAVASVTAVKGGVKRSFDTVGVVIDGRSRLRVEAFGPLGQSVLALVWNGREVLLRLPDEDGIVKPGQAGIERIFGMNVEARELGAVLSGVVAEIARPGEARAYCAGGDACMVVLTDGDTVRRVRVLPASSVSAPAVRISVQEMYRSNKLVYRARYERMQEIAGVLLPRVIVIENPGRNVTLTIEYGDTEVNVPVPEDAFILTDRETEAGGR